MAITLEVCFIANGKGSWVDLHPSTPLPTTETSQDVVDVLHSVAVPEGAIALRVTTSAEIWTFYVHPDIGLVPRMENVGGEVTEFWPSNARLGGIWEVNHVLPDGNLLPVVYVEPDSNFQTGNAEDQTRAKVSVPGGFMAKTPTTIRQWNWFADATNRSPVPTVATSKSGGVIDLNDHPVTSVTYWDACAFAEWAGVGIPSDAVWEHAARGGDGRRYPWGNDPPTDDKCWTSILKQKDGTDDVHKRPNGASPYGCLDMAGNVWEWTSTYHK